MKKLIAMIMVVLMLILVGAGFAETAKEDEGRVLREGKYIIGEDIEAGMYALTCMATAGEQMNDGYGSLGNAFDAIEGGNEFGTLFDMLGGMAEEYVDMTIEIIGDNGDVLKTYTMKTGDTMSITLKEGTALQITDGSCTLKEEG